MVSLRPLIFNLSFSSRLGKEKIYLLPLAFNLSIFSPRLGKEKKFSYPSGFQFVIFSTPRERKKFSSPSDFQFVLFPTPIGKIKGFLEHQNKKLPIFNTFCQEDRGE
jgi:hypothetical protein